MNIKSKLEQFESNGVKVILEWTQESSFYGYNFSVVPHLKLRFGNTTLHLTVPYNTPYNISVVATHLCGENSITAFTELYYGDCMSLIIIGVNWEFIFQLVVWTQQLKLIISQQ